LNDQRGVLKDPETLPDKQIPSAQGKLPQPSADPQENPFVSEAYWIIREIREGPVRACQPSLLLNRLPLINVWIRSPDLSISNMSVDVDFKKKSPSIWSLRRVLEPEDT
jgi:hypothetical protein